MVRLTSTVAFPPRLQVYAHLKPEEIQRHDWPIAHVDSPGGPTARVSKKVILSEKK